MSASSEICVAEYDCEPRGAYKLAMAQSVAMKVRRMRQAMQKTQAEFGELFDPPVSQGTVSRWEKTSIPEGPALAQLADMAGESVSEFLGGPGSKIVPTADRMFMVKGRVKAGVWEEAWQWEEEQWFPYIGGLHVDVPDDRRFGLQVEGDSMDQKYPHGTILDCVTIHELGAPHSGRNVVVIRKRFDGSVEATVKEFVIAPDGKQWLVPRSNNPAFQTPIALGEEDPGIEEVSVLALVVGSYRPE